MRLEPARLYVLRGEDAISVATRRFCARTPGSVQAREARSVDLNLNTNREAPFDKLRAA